MDTATMDGRVWILQRDPEVAVVAEGDNKKRQLLVVAVAVATMDLRVRR